MKTNNVIKLSANENCYGCSKQAINAGMQHFSEIFAYPEVDPNDLKHQLAAKYHVNKTNVVTAAGSVRIIEGLIQTFVGHGGEVLTFDNTFSVYGQLAKNLNRQCRFAPLTDYICLPENLYPYINDNTQLIFIANPNNPTGTIITHNELETFLASVPKNITVVIDEAYAEYVTDASFPDSLALQKTYPNLVIVRSFSKIYGLAALRVGYAILEEKMARKLDSNKIPFSINTIASAAAIAALADTCFIYRSAAQNAEQRELLFTGLKELGHSVIPSQANFLYIDFESSHEKNEVRDQLFHNGILVCDLEKSGQEKALRITIGKAEANKKIISILERQHSLAY